MASINVKIAISEDPALASMFPSTVGQIVTMLQRMGDLNSDEVRDPDLRGKVEEKLYDILGEVKIDRTSWPYVKQYVNYSEYLRDRAAAGTITEYDKIRPGMPEGQFDSPMEYFEHYGRVMEHEKRLEELGLSGSKVCSSCGRKRPVSSFRKGSTCNSCRSKKYRERKANTGEGKEEE